MYDTDIGGSKELSLQGQSTIHGALTGVKVLQARESDSSLWRWALQGVSGGSLSGRGVDEERPGLLADFKI